MRLFSGRRCFSAGGGGAFFTFTSAGVVLCILTAHRQSSAMAYSAIAADIHKSFDRHLDFCAEGAFDFIFGDDAANAISFVVSEGVGSFIGVYAGLFEDFFSAGVTYSKNIGQSDFDAFVFREVDSRDACQSNYPPYPLSGG